MLRLLTTQAYVDLVVRTFRFDVITFYCVRILLFMHSSLYKIDDWTPIKISIVIRPFLLTTQAYVDVVMRTFRYDVLPVSSHFTAGSFL